MIPKKDVTVRGYASNLIKFKKPHQLLIIFTVKLSSDVPTQNMGILISPPLEFDSGSSPLWK